MGQLARWVGVGVLVATSSACALPVTVPVPVPEAIEPGRQYRIEAAGAWTPAERAELSSACDDWRELSGGALDCVVVDDGAPADGHFVRGWDGGRGTERAKLEAARATARFDVDGMRAEGMTLQGGLGALARNIIGVAARIREHDQDGVMSASVAPYWTAADRNVCIEAGFCVVNAPLPVR